ncbi:TolC family protein [Leptospira bourretii]|uniref:TolC family protein n=1 Tax=Leptospira bourretii TaxID=2484962 RepID=UPI00142E20F8|nr:TolC family protein [Leptospira bourretii]
MFLIFVLTFATLRSNPGTADQKILLNFEDAEAIGLTNNVILATLKDRKEVFRMLIKEKWRNYLPKVAISYFGLKNANMNQPDTQYNDIRLQLNQLLYDGGENALEIESAKLQELLNQEDWKIVKDKTVLEVRRYALKYLAFELKHKINRKYSEKMQLSITAANEEKSKGFITDLQFLELQTKVREFDLSLVKSKSQSNIAHLDLLKSMNMPIETQIIFKNSIVQDFEIIPPNEKLLSEDFIFQKPEIKKSRLAIENLRTRAEIVENYWKPKVVFGSYYGQNTNSPLPVANEVYGFNISLQAQLGSSTTQSAANYGVQTDGTGIQRIPGYGPQFVGKGENAFNSSTVNLFDDLSYSRKIYEGKIALSDAIRNKQLLEVTVRADIHKSYEKLDEAWEVIRVMNSKVALNREITKTVKSRYAKGFAKKIDILSAEYDLLKSYEELLNSLMNYIDLSFEMAFILGTPFENLELVKIRQGKGNSFIKENFDTDLTDLAVGIN